MVDALLVLGVSLILASFLADFTQGLQRQPIRIDDNTDSKERRSKRY